MIIVLSFLNKPVIEKMGLNEDRKISQSSQVSQDHCMLTAFQGPIQQTARNKCYWCSYWAHFFLSYPMPKHAFILPTPVSLQVDHEQWCLFILMAVTLFALVGSTVLNNTAQAGRFQWWICPSALPPRAGYLHRQLMHCLHLSLLGVPLDTCCPVGSLDPWWQSWFWEGPQDSCPPLLLVRGGVQMCFLTASSCLFQIYLWCYFLTLTLHLLSLPLSSITGCCLDLLCDASTCHC